MLRIRKFGENSCGYNAAQWSCRSVLRGYATMSFRQGYVCDPSQTVRDSLQFNRLMRNFKRNSVFYERERRNFDRIELRRRSRRKDGDSKRDRRSRADSVETLRTSKTSAFNRVLTHTYARSLKLKEALWLDVNVSNMNCWLRMMRMRHNSLPSKADVVSVRHI